jgi:hypothetical protein
VVVTVPLGQTGNHHISVTNRLNLQTLKGRAMVVEIRRSGNVLHLHRVGCLTSLIFIIHSVIMND